MATCICELLWISYFLQDMSIPVPFICDNNAALDIILNSVFHDRTKHIIDIDCHIVRQRCKEGFINPQFFPSQLQLADIFTKSLSQPHFSTIYFSQVGCYYL